MTPDEWEARVAEVAPDVDLSVAFSPVLPLRTGSHVAALVPVKVYRDASDGYILHMTGGNEKATAEELRPMRARFLLRREEYYLRLPTMGPRERERILEAWFDGRADYMIGALELAAKQPDPAQPILTVTYEEGNPDAKHAAIKQSIEAMGPAVSLESRARMERTAPRHFDDYPPDEDNGRLPATAEQILAIFRGGQQIIAMQTDGWQREGSTWTKAQGPYTSKVWPAGTFAIWRDGKLAKQGTGGKEAADKAMEEP